MSELPVQLVAGWRFASHVVADACPRFATAITGSRHHRVAQNGHPMVFWSLHTAINRYAVHALLCRRSGVALPNSIDGQGVLGCPAGGYRRVRGPACRQAAPIHDASSSQVITAPLSHFHRKRSVVETTRAGRTGVSRIKGVHANPQRHPEFSIAGDLRIDAIAARWSLDRAPKTMRDNVRESGGCRRG